MNANLTTASAAAVPTRDRLADLPRRLLYPGRNFSKAAISLVDEGSRVFVLKDFAGRAWPVRHLLGPWQLRREAAAYRLLAGLAGVPIFLGSIDRQAIALQHVEGPALRALRPGALDGPFFDRLESLVRGMHARGVAHGDLHHGDVLAGPAGQPFVIDFSTCSFAPSGPIGVRRLVFDEMRRADLRSVAKLRRRLAPAGAPEPPPHAGLYRFAVAVRRLFRR